MITWMQRHRKYLVITIWVSTIAFVGSGFVGWGSFNYGSMGSKVAEVGKVEITKDEFASAYSNIYQYYSRMFGGKLGEKEIKSLGIQNAALQTLINQALVENFSKEYELSVSDEEVALKIASMDTFKKDGAFSEPLYYDMLKKNHLKAKDFEAGLKKELLMQKAGEFLKPKVTLLESRAIANSMFGSDRIEIKVLKLNDIKVTVSEEEIKAYWDKNKNNFKSQSAYDLEIAKVEFGAAKVDEEELKKAFAEYGSNYKDQNGTALSYALAKPELIKEETKRKTKKEALKKFIELKNGQLQGTKLAKIEVDTALMEKLASMPGLDETLTAGMGNKNIPINLQKELAKLKDADNIKPVEYEKGFVFGKVTKIYKPEVLPYESAKPNMTLLLKEDKTKIQLKEQAKKEAASFKGVDFGFVSKADFAKIKFLEQDEAQKFLNDLFESKKENGYSIFKDKAIMYRILEQKLLSNEEYEAKKDFLVANILPFKASAMNESVLEHLKSKYKVKVHIDIANAQSKSKDETK
jgi:peptidyl-prolyl cis-trans isomerase D